MSKLPALTPKKLLKFLKTKGFYLARQSGSHMILHTSHNRTLRVTIPIHNKDMKIKTLISALKQAGLDKSVLTDKN
ncbi:MAG TPA: type II toxin-antitoxin system HicA family toxin [Patescibacteria group bacterium]|nr:type II toxin-antitoxin system HicA family toxin [Patescibacteria group bacterium]